MKSPPHPPPPNLVFFSGGGGGGEVGPLCRFTFKGFIFYSFQLAGKMTAIVVMNIAAFRYPVFLLDWLDAEQGQPGIYTNVHPACSHCWWRKGIDPHRLYFWRWKGVHTTYCTSILLVGERNTLWFCTVHTPGESGWWWKWYTLHIHRQLLLVYSCCMMPKNYM